ncbi:conserved Plasmodium protein, unknown function [Plasmodium vivax]|uniref:Uncharacterized protein n=5 Tax=Plasmodium vivax TaxID=5855 RepID=A5K0K7_PLAVS|nr:hypothetical protein, conserved [Plasmodium vivax]KMZ83641.1 hypothetical protein PVBG_00721 [Plasmodium vivax Brazil I]KMZ90841.1 hypothetical protein PVMG_04030 [Plasmodium vivax Mauritania I]KMZ97625.1 hypothetical protein PVNG_01362 [Plasmodium vivax North Korean]EDL46854.1 hypothetical protein, conserved [Plasmodium vivax]CAG9475488.1 unnamed protein product [Plasmodium vivax]|eukprot:XP_001616581.1 hypothetical protein [Plasmodium vivax Sal-1]
MIAASGERFDDERRSCFKYFLTLMFLLVLMLILRKQKEEEEEISSRAKMNLRQNEHYRNFAFSYLREISFLKYDSAVYISPNRKIVPMIRYINNYTVYVQGYDNILHNFENVSVGISEEKNNLYIYAVANNRLENGTCASAACGDADDGIINTVLVDTTLFRNMQIGSCLEKDTSMCFFVFVQLSKSKCYSFNNLSHSCHANNTVKNPNVFLASSYCYVVLASSKVERIYEFVKEKLLGKDPFDEKTSTKEVEIVAHFCGNLLNQIATIDAVNARLLFVQRYIRKFDKGGQEESNERRDSDSPSASNGNNPNADDQTNSPVNFNTEQNQKEEYQRYTKSYLHNDSFKNENNSNALKLQISYHFTVINLASENRDIVEYVEYAKNKPEFCLFPPIHIAFDEQSNFYYIVQHENNGFLNFIFISPSTLLVYYTLKIREFYSGWLLNSSRDYDSKGLILFGEYPPYEDELHVWDIRTLQHRKYLVNIIKTY